VHKNKSRFPRFLTPLLPCSFFPNLQPEPFFMTDLTILHAPSALYLPEVKDETGFRFTFNRQSLPPLPLVSTPMVTVEMVDENSPPSSPVKAQDNSFLSPPRRSFKSKQPPRVSPPRPHSAPPGPSSGENGIIDRHDRFPPRPKTINDPFSNRPSPVPIVERPPTILCACIIPF
jgi:hypothetical protein